MLCSEGYLSVFLFKHFICLEKDYLYAVTSTLYSTWLSVSESSINGEATLSDSACEDASAGDTGKACGAYFVSVCFV